MYIIMPSSFYPSQTKILEGGTKDECWLFEALFKVVSVEKPDFIICSSFQNLRLGSIHLANHFLQAKVFARLALTYI
jgi:hypothetical protein